MSSETIFVSYSSKDRPFTLALVKELQSLGANIWIDQLDIGLGENWDNAIEEALEKSQTIMIILSPTSVESQNVQDEVSIAISANKKMVPILIKPCELPMRWQRRQYADLANNPDKAINDILHFLGLQEKAFKSLKKLLSLIGVGEAPNKADQIENEISHDKDVEHEALLKNLLVSDTEIERAIQMHKKGIKKNWQMTVVTAILSIALSALVIVFKNSGIFSIDIIYAVIACLSINLLSVRLFGVKKKRERNIDLIELLKLKRERLTRIINKLSDKEIGDFNDEFYKYITV